MSREREVVRESIESENFNLSAAVLRSDHATPVSFPECETGVGSLSGGD